MAARLVFLGRLADLAGAGERSVESGSLDVILARLPADLALALVDEKIRMALNGQLVPRDVAPILRDGDELAFLPPVSGG